jgi:hypothetical protein
MNPFAGWKPDEQCFGKTALNADGEAVASTSTQAVKWCALGRLFRCYDDYWIEEFSTWFAERYGERLMIANDSRHWLPSRFITAWDEFEKGTHAR